MPRTSPLLFLLLQVLLSLTAVSQAVAQSLDDAVSGLDDAVASDDEGSVIDDGNEADEEEGAASMRLLRVGIPLVVVVVVCGGACAGLKHLRNPNTQASG